MPHIFKHMQELKDSPLSHLSSHILIVRGEGSYHTIQESKDFQDFLIKKRFVISKLPLLSLISRELKTSLRKSKISNLI